MQLWKTKQSKTWLLPLRPQTCYIIIKFIKILYYLICIIIGEVRCPHSGDLFS
jgi:hypothetical protein